MNEFTSAKDFFDQGKYVVWPVDYSRIVALQLLVCADFNKKFS